MVQYIGDEKPTAEVLVYPDAEITTQNTFTRDNNIAYRVLSEGVRELTLPRVKSIVINKDIEADAATCTITAYDPLGDLNPTNYGETWECVIVPNTLIKTKQGYGDSDLEQTGVWLIDEVDFNNPPNIVTIRCRDLAKLLIEQTLYPPLILSDYYPVGFCTTNDKQINEIYKKTKRWIPYDDLSEIVKFFLRLAGFDSWTIESTGVMVTLEEMSQMMLIDAINRIKDIVGYRFYIDQDGIPNFVHAPISGTTIPSYQYLIHRDTDIINITRSLRDTYARSKITCYGKTIGGVGNINVIPPKDISKTRYENRQIYNKYCFAYQSGQDWLNFKQWVCGMSASESDSWNGVTWIPSHRRGSGSNYFGMKCFQKVKSYQIRHGLISWYQTRISSPRYLQWGDEILGTSGSNILIRRYRGTRKVGNFFGATKDHWNRTHARVPVNYKERVPGRTEIDYDELKVISGTYDPSHYLTPLNGQIRVATYSDEALENKNQCEEMARMIDFWANVQNNSFEVELIADNKYDVGHVAYIFEPGVGSKVSQILVVGLNSNMDLETGKWVMNLSVVDIDPFEPGQLYYIM